MTYYLLGKQPYLKMGVGEFSIKKLRNSLYNKFLTPALCSLKGKHYFCLLYFSGGIFYFLIDSQIKMTFFIEFYSVSVRILDFFICKVFILISIHYFQKNTRLVLAETAQNWNKLFTLIQHRI